MKGNTQDLTKGSIVKAIILFSIPLLIGNLFQQLYNAVDSYVVGNYVGKVALAAVGASTPIINMLIGFFMGISTGAGVVIAQFFGAGNTCKMKRAIHNSIALTLVMGVVLTIVGLLFNDPILKAIGVPSEVFSEASTYLSIYFWSLIFVMVYNMGSGILRSVGDSKRPLYFLIFSSVLNIILDYVLIKFTQMGVKGAAVATVLAQLLSVILCFVVILKNFKIIRLKKNDFHFSASLFKNMMSAGMAMAVMNSIFSIGSIIMQGSINALGEDVIAAHLGSRKVAEMFMQPLVTIGTACSTFVGQNYGALKIGRIKASIKYSTIYSLIWSVFTFFILWFFGGQIARLVTGSASQVVFDNTQMYLRINAPFYFVLGLLFTLRFSIQSVDRKMPPIISSSMELASKIAAAYLFIPLWGYLGACIAEPLSWTLGAIYLLFVFKKEFKRLDGLAEKQKQKENIMGLKL